MSKKQKMPKNRPAIGLCAVGAAALILAAALLLGRRNDPGPLFEGRTVTSWITAGDYYWNKKQVSEAVLASGERAVPTLRHLLRSGTPIERLILQKAPPRLWNRRPLSDWRSHISYKERAMAGLELLGDAGRAAAPDILKIIADSTESSEMRKRAMQVLIAVRAQPAHVTRVLERLRDDPVVGDSARLCLSDLKTGRFWPVSPPTVIYHHERGERLMCGFEDDSLPRFSPAPDQNFLLLSKPRFESDPSKLLKEAEAGNVDAQLQLATRLSEAQEGTKDLVSAYKWVLIASAGGHSAKHLERELELFMSASQLAQAKEGAREVLSHR